MWATGKSFFSPKTAPWLKGVLSFSAIAHVINLSFLKRVLVVPLLFLLPPATRATWDCSPYQTWLPTCRNVECRGRSQSMIEVRKAAPSLCESRGEKKKKNFTYTARWSLGIEIVALNPRLLCSNLSLHLSDRGWSASGHPVAALQSGYWPSVESENGEPGLKHSFSYTDQYGINVYRLETSPWWLQGGKSPSHPALRSTLRLN